MQLEQAVSILLVAILMICTVMLLSGFRRSGRKALAARLSLIDSGDHATPGAGRAAAHEIAFVRYPIGRLHEREMREVAGVFRRWRIAPRHIFVAFMVARAGFAVIGVAVALLALQTLFHGDAPLWVRIALLMIGAMIGWSAPMLMAHAAAEERAAAVAKGLPEALELLVVCVEAGLALENGIARVTEEIRPSQPVLADELGLTAADLKVLPNLDEGLANLAARVDLPNVRSVVAILSQSLRYGTPLAEALRSAAAEMRNEDLIKLEERGNRLPTLLTLPMMLFIMPTIFLIVGGPAALKVFDAFGH